MPEKALNSLSHVLVVDDDPAVLKMVALILEAEGYNVLTGHSVAAAFELATLHKEQIGLLVVDHSVTGERGRTLVEEIGALQPQSRMLRFSGQLESELRANREMRPDSFFIQKPFSPRQLIDKVREIIGPAQRWAADAAEGDRPSARPVVENGGHSDPRTTKLLAAVE